MAETSLTDNEQTNRLALQKSKPIVYDKCLAFPDQPAQDKSIAIIQLQYRYACNFHCSHCSISGFRKKTGGRLLDIKTVKRVFDEAHAYGLAHVAITGGEPLVFKDLEQLIEAIGPERFHIQLDTNGWLMSKQTAEWLKIIGVDKIQLSIDGLDANEHDTFRNKQGSHERCMRAIETIQAAGLALQVATCVNHDRAQSEELAEFLRLMRDMNAPVSVVYAKPVGEYANHPEFMCTPDDIAHVKRLLELYGGYDHTSKQYGLDLGCIAVKRMISITAMGDVLPCPWMYFSLGNVFDISLADILNKGMSYFKYNPVCRLSEDKEFAKKYVPKMRDDLPPIEEVMND